MAEILNKHGIKTYYASVAWDAKGHDSAMFHYGKIKEDWDISDLFYKGLWNHKKNVSILKQIKSKYDIRYCFATGHRAHILKKANIDYNYWSYGSDLDQCCRKKVHVKGISFWKRVLDYFYSAVVFLRDLKMFVPKEYFFIKKAMVYMYLLLSFCREQKKSICCADSLMIASYQSENYSRLCLGKRLFFIPHLANVMDYTELSKIKNESKRKVSKKIGTDIFFFSSTRHFWYGKHNLFTDYKGNDIILYSFMHYLKIAENKNSKLILIRKGPDVAESKRLIEYLKINDNIVWLDEMKRDELSAYYQGASACLGQFGTPALTFTAVEPLSNGTSCVSFFGDNKPEVPFYNKIPPVLNSKDPYKIADFMHKVVSEPEYALKLSYESWLWAKENCSEERFVETFLREMQFRNEGKI
jgi:hypothetical protein